MLPMQRRRYFEVGLEEPMPDNSESWKHCPAKYNRVTQRSAIHVLDHIRQPCPNEHFSNWFNQSWPIVRVPIPLCQVGIGLARRRRVNCVKCGQIFRRERHRILLNEGQWVARLRRDINTHNLETRSVVADASAPGATKQVKNSGLPDRLALRLLKRKGQWTRHDIHYRQRRLAQGVMTPIHYKNKVFRQFTGDHSSHSSKQATKKHRMGLHGMQAPCSLAIRASKAPNIPENAGAPGGGVRLDRAPGFQKAEDLRDNVGEGILALQRAARTSSRPSLVLDTYERPVARVRVDPSSHNTWRARHRLRLRPCSGPEPS